MSPARDLSELLTGLFDPAELRRFVSEGPEGPGIRAGLPGPTASPLDVCESAVDQLERRGLIDYDLFDRLIAERPRRQKDIERVRTRWLAPGELYSGAIWADGLYQLVEPLGSGGYGLVWKALATETQEFVALKILHEQHALDLIRRQRFVRGAEVLARLRHPGLVAVRGHARREGGRLYFVMEYVAGETLEELVGRHGLDAGALLPIALQIGEALAFLHSEGLIHRDVKPSNILVSPAGRARLCDFDLVRGGAFANITTSTIGGSLLYAAPETLTGVAEATVAADVYGLAMTTATALAGVEPIPHTVATDLESFLAQVPADPSVRAALRRALHPDPRHRTRAIGSLCEELRGPSDARAAIPTNPPRVVPPELLEDHIETPQEPDVPDTWTVASRRPRWTYSVVAMAVAGSLAWIVLHPDDSTPRTLELPELEVTPGDPPLLHSPYGAATSPVGVLGTMASPERPSPVARQGTATVRGELDKDIIRRIVRAHLGEIRYCYASALKKRPGLTGRVEIHFRIDDTGKVDFAEVGKTSIADKDVGPCIAEAVRRWTFPKPANGPVFVDYPFMLAPK